MKAKVAISPTLAPDLKAHAHFSAASANSSRRLTAAIMFSDLSGSTSIAATLEAEEYAELLCALQAIYRRVVAAQGGQIAQISADGMMAAFGHPEPGEGDIRHAVEAALELRDSVRALARDQRWRTVAPKVHTGIHSGRVLLLSGDDERGRFELLGTPTNIASRLCDEAGPDQILIGARTLGPHRCLFETSAAFNLRLRGREQPLSTVAVVGRAASGDSAPTPLVGRQAELAILERHLERIRSGAGTIVAIRSPPGEGKTRLAEEFLRRARDEGFQIHRARCEATGAALHPFVDIARSVFGIGPALRPDQARKRLNQGLEQIGPDLLRDRGRWLRLLSLAATGKALAANDAAAAFSSLLAGLTQRAPLLLFIDDWHAADDASRTLLGALAGASGVYLLLTARPDARGKNEFGERETIWLPPLGAAETDCMVDLLLAAPDPFARANIRSCSGGKPLFIEELCHAYGSGGIDFRPVEGTAWVGGLVQSRLARLPTEQADLVRAAAIVGEIVPAWLLEQLCGRDTADPMVTGLAEADFVFPGEREGTLRFKHGLTREIVYDGIGLYERRAMHRAIGEAVRRRAAATSDDPVETLAYHFGRAECWEEAADYAERAGDRALAAGAVDRAQTHFREALVALDRQEQTPEVTLRWIALAERFGRAGVFDPARDQVAICERAVKQARFAGEPATLARAHFWLGYIYYGLGEAALAVPHCEQALEAAKLAGDDPLLVQIVAALGQAKAAACDYDGALPLLDEAVEVKRRHRSGRNAPIGLAYSLSCKGFALGDMGRFDEAASCFAEAEAALAGFGHPGEVSVLNQHAVVCLWQRQPAQALDLAEAGMRVAERVGSSYSHAMSRSIAAYARWCVDRAPTAVETLAEATAWLEARQRGQFTSLNYGWLAEMAAATGDGRSTLRHARRALARARKGDRLGEATALRALAMRARRVGGARRPALFLDLAERCARARRSPHEEVANLSCREALGLEPMPLPGGS